MFGHDLVLAKHIWVFQHLVEHVVELLSDNTDNFIQSNLIYTVYLIVWKIFSETKYFT